MNPFSAKATGWLLLVLIVSLSANIWQLHRAGVAQGRGEGELERADLAGQVAQLATSQAVSKALAEQGRADHTNLLTQLDAIAERGQKTRIVYRQAASAAPLSASCAPGAARMDAVNSGLGPTSSGARP